MNVTMQSKLGIGLAVLVAGVQFVLTFLQSQANVDGMGVTHQAVTWSQLIGGIITTCAAVVMTQLASSKQAAVVEQQQAEIDKHDQMINTAVSAAATDRRNVLNPSPSSPSSPSVSPPSESRRSSD